MRFMIFSLLFLLILPLSLQAGEGSSLTTEEDNVIIYRNSFSKEEQDLNRLRSLTREEHSWEMLKSMRIEIELNNFKDSLNSRTSR